ncbi:MAG: HupE/UreJ family protein [Gammaproteobacteria bacterium]
MTKRPAAGLLYGLLFLFCSSAGAHKPSDSYLKLTVDGGAIDGQWDIALRDLDHALGIDADGDGAITWGELRRRHEDIAAYALSRLAIHAGDAACDAKVRDHLVDNHADGAYAVLRFDASCPDASGPLRITYRLFFDLDPQHKGLLNVTHDGRTYTGIFSPRNDSWHLESAASSRTGQFFSFLREGIWHIWIGLDHILFLLSLLLPSVLVREEGRWRAVASLGPAVIDVVKIVTAFTVAHSITLSLAALEMIALPSRLVESVIAASVVLAALNNLYPVVTRRLWVIAFAFGLVHGVGFANVLAGLGLPKTGLLKSLLAFNVGVEVGQLAIVGVFLPLAYLMRRSWSYQVMTLRIGSASIAVIACAWLLERSVGLAFT